MQLVLISGLSGSGKSIALNVLEDAGYYCVDNLPATLLPRLMRQLRNEGYEKVAVAVDVRSGMSIAALPQQVTDLSLLDIDVRFIFLDARDETLIARFSETRRRHPLADERATLAEAIAKEREALERVAELGHRVDTSDLQANALRAWVKDFIRLDAAEGLTLLFESFGFKHGIPLDADLVFDVRCLPNPHYDPQLRPHTGKDAPVIEFLERQPDVARMAEDVRKFVDDWLPCFIRDNRSYLTVAIGCTGGQHRSVYLAEWLARQFEGKVRVLVRHRSLR
ncbi:MAG TPA: RNase adapter RapZ [Rhodocyclaceae bacterium]|nr:RNase adapter RapZ [Rhodocyclaceae bacterium]HMV53949.1 RNase adapter RapZ [Rhodocyclaceae bacterium]HMZ84474.1 RNase adapter RapZ [Rhodocyclaceae bacterium]HNA04026.1 RNase adapter RapZ [Rhodocyclaceae bacterium]HNB79657.1 RNase adapter RapZ [Rhodocyclaceae bacterium]